MICKDESFEQEVSGFSHCNSGSSGASILWSLWKGTRGQYGVPRRHLRSYDRTKFIGV